MSKLMMFDFECRQGHIFEDLTHPADTPLCPVCRSDSRPIISPVRIDRSAIALTKGASPESIAHFDRVHRERKAIEEKRYERNGDYGSAAGAD